MRNLKRVLALALALVMVIGMMVMGASAASYTDAADISAEYVEAIDVMTGVGMFEGEDDGSFLPQEVLTRKHAAALLARLTLGEKTADKLIATKQIFTDVATTAWYAPYVEYCYQAGLIDGLGNGTFNPDGELTGIAFAKLILVAMGYDADAQGYVGKDWASNIAVDALNAGLKVADVVLADVVTREVAAQMLYQALTQTMVEYTTAYDKATGAPVLVGPNKMANKVIDADETYNGKVDGYTQFVEYYFPKLVKTGEGNDATWGRPYDYAWVYNTKPLASTLYVAWEEAAAVYYNVVNECKIASDVGLYYDTDFDLYTNGIVNKSLYTVQPTDTVQTIGAQGTSVEVYEDEIVVIDTFLAKVEKVTPVIKDAAGHKIANATIELTVYNTAAGTTVKDVSLTNYTYAKGDMVLVNLYTTNTVAYYTGDVTVNAPAVDEDSYGAYVDILGLAKTEVGTQTYQWLFANKHTINGVDYADAKWLKLNQAGYESAAHTWYFDQYDNVIGATDIRTVYGYGVIENIQWINPVGAPGYAQATIRYMDGTTALVVVDEIDGKYPSYTADTPTTVFVSENISKNGALCHKDLYRIETSATGSVELTEIVDNSTLQGYQYEGEIGTASINYSTKPGTHVLAAIYNGYEAAYTNANTKFLIQTAKAVGNNVLYTYKAVEGYAEVPAYNDALVDFVDLDKDGYADYVFIIGATVADDSYNLFFRTSPAVQTVLNAKSDTVEYYVYTGILNGVPGQTIKVLPTAGVANLKMNAMACIRIVDGYVTAAGDLSTFDGSLASVDPYKLLSVDYNAASNTPGTVTKNGTVLKVGSAYYTVIGLEPVVGTWADDMSGKNIYVIYDQSVVIGNSYVAKEVYIFNKDADDQDSGIVPPVITPVNPTIESVNLTTGGTFTLTLTGLTNAKTEYEYTLYGRTDNQDAFGVVEQGTVNVKAGKSTVVKNITGLTNGASYYVEIGGVSSKVVRYDNTAATTVSLASVAEAQPATRAQSQQLFSNLNQANWGLWGNLPSLGLTQTISGTTLALSGELTDVINDANYAQYKDACEQWLSGSAPTFYAFKVALAGQGFDMSNVTDVAFASLVIDGQVAVTCVVNQNGTVRALKSAGTTFTYTPSANVGTITVDVSGLEF